MSLHEKFLMRQVERDDIVVHRGLTWVKESRPDARFEDERVIWRLDWPVHTRFVLKNYGESRRNPEHYSGEDPFSGVRLVSGGPFTSVGKWSTFWQAMDSDDLIDFLVTYAKKEARKCEGHALQLRRFVEQQESS